MKNFTLILLIIIIGSPAIGQETVRLSLDHYKDYEWTSNPKLSPDGRQILYSRSWINLVDDRRETDLWIMNRDGKMNRFFLNGSNGKWSPDGTKMLFTRSQGGGFMSNLYTYVMDVSSLGIGPDQWSGEVPAIEAPAAGEGGDAEPEQVAAR